MKYIYYGQYCQETKKIIIKNIGNPETDVGVIIDNIKPGNWNIWTGKINKKGFYNSYAIIYCDEDDGNILTNHNLADYIEPINWCYENTIVPNSNGLVLYDKKYYNKDKQWKNEIYEIDEPEIMQHGIVFGSDNGVNNRIYVSIDMVRDGKIVGIKIIQND